MNDELRKKIEKAETLEEIQEIRKEILKEQKEQIRGELEDKNKEIASSEIITDEEERKLLRKSTVDQEKEKIFVKIDSKREERNMDDNQGLEVLEKRGADLRSGKAITVKFDDVEERSMTVSSGKLLVEKKYKKTIDEAFEGVSGIVDELNHMPLNGGDSYSVSFEKEIEEGDYTEEGKDYTEIDPDVDYVETGRAKITAYSEITKESKKLPNVDYQALVIKRVRTAIRKKIGKQCIAGTGGANTITGIYNADIKVLPKDSKTADISISKIDADTLNTIVFAYGGDESLEAEQKLLLSKKDLEEFSKEKTVDGKFVYKITRNGQTGRIGYSEGGLDVPYTINSGCKSLSDTTTVDGDFTMVYGSLASYEFPVFSELEIEESTDFQFKKGIISYRGDVIVGGTVAKYKGFVRVKKLPTA